MTWKEKLKIKRQEAALRRKAKEEAKAKEYAALRAKRDKAKECRKPEVMYARMTCADVGAYITPAGLMCRRQPKEVYALRQQAAKSANICADCFTPLTPSTSVTLVRRRVIYDSEIMGTITRDILTPICISCSLVPTSYPTEHSLVGRAPWCELEELIRSPKLPWRKSVAERLWRFRCKGCGRPMRILIDADHRPTLRQRTCCEDCHTLAQRRRDSERRKVEHAVMTCAVCEEEFIPRHSTAKVCSNKCRQRAHRERHRNPS